MPLSTRLFRARLEMIAELDKRVASGTHVAEAQATYGDQLTDEQLRGDLAGFLHQQVASGTRGHSRRQRFNGSFQILPAIDAVALETPAAVRQSR
ncbi:hypothetical protein SAMN05216344_101285 [Polaromonas sp. OV174]|uniref:hypothetical protein n=1 Tax=Polaromonas sp. OV174 TaxID=1855300 RepID=UPI0008E54FB9|nr:hypothetical protein [Polaromonas sp. OV174]SFB69429.1 hypothetical protein SAMN05216344_101285 [Polaromonas sp. OV174]